MSHQNLPERRRLDELRNNKPRHGVHLASFPAHTNSEVEEAIARAHSTYHVWRLSTFRERAAVLRKVADLMRRRIEPLAAMITLEMGKLIEHSRGETLLSADILTLLRRPRGAIPCPSTTEAGDRERDSPQPTHRRGLRRRAVKSSLLTKTMEIFEKYGVHILSPEEVVAQMPEFPPREALTSLPRGILFCAGTSRKLTTSSCGSRDLSWKGNPV